MNRRTLLKAAGIATAGVLVAGFGVYTQIPDIPKRPSPNAQEARGWIRYENGAFTLSLPRIEMGQNIATALKQIACDELEVAWNDVTVVLHETARMAPVRATVGSESVMVFGIPLAQACAAMREAIAAGRADGEITVMERPLDRLRAFDGSGSHVGRSVLLEQGDAIVRGVPTFASDVRLDDMLYGRVLFPPTLPEFAVNRIGFDRAAAERVRGFEAIVEDPLLELGANAGIGIVARTPGALDRVEAALAVQWTRPAAYSQRDIATRVNADQAAGGTLPTKTVTTTGDVEAMKTHVDVRIDTPTAAHAPMEPRVAVADYREEGSLTLWVGNQDAYFVHDKIAKRLGLDHDKVNVLSQRVGGGFGGKTICTVEMEAAILSRATGRPVKVQWTRAQEFRQGFHRPPTSHRIQADVGDGRLKAWKHTFVSSHILFTNAVVPTWMQAATNMLVGDPGVARGAELGYDCDAVSTTFGLERLPLFTGPWRGLGAGPNLLAIESAIDECAIKAEIDPVSFRLTHLKNDRLRRAVERVAKLAGWKGPGSTEDGDIRTGRGIACGIYKDMSYAATIANVTIDAAGAVRVTELFCTHDCGRVINPDQVRAQCEGNLVWGLGFVLGDKLMVEHGAITSIDFIDSPIPILSEVPPMEIDLIDEGESPSGAGETVIVSAMGAIANAVRAATGKRIERFPIETELLAA